MPASAIEANVPILGQVVKVLGYTVLPLIHCQCGGASPVSLVASFADGQWQVLKHQCPHCQNVYDVSQIDMDPRGHLRFGIQVSKPVSV